jgi:hypothetical protein
MLICRALIKYGYSNFSLEILEYCAPEERFVRENHYIKNFAPEYNIVQESNTMPSRLKHIHSDTSKLKIGFSQPSRIMVSVTDILSNTETIFDSLGLAAKFLNVNSGQISLYFTRNQVKPFKKRYIIKIINKPLLGETKVIET